MKHKVYYWLIGFICYCVTAQAQWTEQDSVWLQQVLSGEVELLLTPEVDNAIKSGTFLNIDPEAPALLLSPIMLEIIKDIPEAALWDPHYRELLILSLPVQVFKQYPFKADSGLVIHRQALTTQKSLVVKDHINLGNGLYVKAGAGNLFLPEVRDGQWRGSLNGSVGGTFSMEDILCALFSPTERNKKKNRKNATAWKTYNMDTMY